MATTVPTSANNNNSNFRSSTTTTNGDNLTSTINNIGNSDQMNNNIQSAATATTTTQATTIVAPPQDATRRLQTKKQTLDDAYAVPANFLEIDVCNPITHGVARNRYTDYEVRMRSNLPIFKLKESSVRRRYSDFEWLRSELERDSKIMVPPLPGKAWKRQLPFRQDDGIFDDEFIEDRRKGLEQFINKVAGHPLAQNERCLHMFLQDQTIDKSYVPGKIRNS